MDKKQKQDVDIDIYGLITSVTGDKNSNNTKDVALYIRGDSEFELATLFVLGDIGLLSSTIIHHIEENEQFKRFLLATIGSYFIARPEEKEMFEAGIELMKQQAVTLKDEGGQ